jgi:hypothetical protein
MRLGVHDRAERALVDKPPDLGDRRFVAPLMSNTEHHSGLAAGLDGTLSVAAREGERLLAEHMLAGARHREHLLGVHGVRRAQDDGVDAGVTQHVGKVRGET